MTTTTVPVPNPGSERAQRIGCCCPVMDNCGGHWAPRPPDGWVITVGCPVHDRTGRQAAA